MRILTVISESPPTLSGMSRVCKEMMTNFVARGHSVDILSNVNIPRLVIGDVRLSSMALYGIKNIVIPSKKYDVIHIHGPAPTFSDISLLLASINRRLSQAPIIYSHHCEIAIPRKDRICHLYNSLNRKLSLISDHIVVSTPSYAHLFRSKERENVSIIPWGVSPRKISIKTDGFNILFIGQMRPYKGLETLLNAVAHNTAVRLDIIGDGYLLNHYREMIRKLNLNNVRILGRVSDDVIENALKRAHVIVLPSLTKAEAFGLVLLEGMSAGCVPVASRLPGITDVIGKAGYTFEPGNDRELSSVLSELQNNRSKLNSLSEASRCRSEQFSWSKTSILYENLFTNLIQHNKSKFDCFPI